MLPIFPMDGGKVVRSLALVCMTEKMAVYVTSAASGVALVALLVCVGRQGEKGSERRGREKR